MHLFTLPNICYAANEAHIAALEAAKAWIDVSESVM
jgi:hypothetical protein